MKNHQWKTILHLTMFLSLAATLTFLIILPDQVPMHYNEAGEINRWGSKYENLIICALPLAAGAIALAVARQYRKNGERGGRGEKIALAAGCCAVLYFGVLAVVLLVQAYRVTASGGVGQLDLNRILFTILGLFLIPIGNILPKLGRRDGAGTPEGQWRINRAGGAALMILGGVAAAGNAFFVPEAMSLWFTIGCLVVAAVTVTVCACGVLAGFGKEQS